MKRIAMFMSALALAFSFTACDQKEDGNGNGNGVQIDGKKDANLTFSQVVVDKGEDGGASKVLYMHRKAHLRYP